MKTYTPGECPEDIKSWRFHVVSTGSSIDLPVNKILTAGNGLQNDIVVNSGKDSWTVLLENIGHEVSVTSLIGEITHKNRALDKDDKVIIAESTTLIAGDTQLRILRSDTTESQAANSPAVDSQNTEQTEFTNSTVKQDWSTVNPGIIKASSAQYFAKQIFFGTSALCVGLGVLSAIYAITGSLFIANADTESSYQDFVDSLRQPEFNNLQYRLSTDRQRYIITGFIDTRKQKAELLELAQVAGINIELDLQINNELIEVVEDIYRVNGISATAKVLESGNLQVHTSTDDLEKLEMVGMSVRADIPRLSEFEVKNTPPNTTLGENSSYTQDPDKRITLISSGTSAFIMTQDQSRYFVGALLPSGHLVESIESNQILLSKNGEREILKY